MYKELDSIRLKLCNNKIMKPNFPCVNMLLTPSIFNFWSNEHKLNSQFLFFFFFEFDVLLDRTFIIIAHRKKKKIVNARYENNANYSQS